MKISVITAVYNAETTVGAAIASVATQTHPAVEHIIIEGQSTDGSLAAIAKASHPRLRLFSAADTGIYDALNRGIAQATGDVIGFVHSDDYLAHPNVLAHIAAAFTDSDVQAVFGDLDYVAQANPARVIRHWATGPFTPAKLRRGWMPAHPTLYVRRHLYDRHGLYDTTFRIAADYDFILRVFSALDGRAVYLPTVLYKMRVGGASNRNLTQIRRKMAEDLRALRRNKVGGVTALTWKNLSKLGQFLHRAKDPAQG